MLHKRSKNKHTAEAHILLETGTLPIELLPYGCAMMITEREGFVKIKNVPRSSIPYAFALANILYSSEKSGTYV
jgi:hypothetical protein